MMMKLASSAALLVVGAEAGKFYKPNVASDYAHGEALAKSSDPSALEGAYCAYTWHAKQGLTHAAVDGGEVCDMRHGGCNAPVYVLPAGETKDCCKGDQAKLYKATLNDKEVKTEEFTDLSAAVSWKTQSADHKGKVGSPVITAEGGKMFGTAMYNAVIQDAAPLRKLVDAFSMTAFRVHTTEIKVGDKKYNALKASFVNSNGLGMKEMLENLAVAVKMSCKLAKDDAAVQWRSAQPSAAVVGPPAIPADAHGVITPAVNVAGHAPTDAECDNIVAGIVDIDIHTLMKASDSTIIAPCSKDFAQQSKRETVPKGQGLSKFHNTHARVQGPRNARAPVHAMESAELPIASVFTTPTNAAGADCLGAAMPVAARKDINDRHQCGFSNISAGTTFADGDMYGGFMRVNAAAAGTDHDAAAPGTSYFVSQTTYFVTKSGVQLQKSVQFAEAAQQAYNDLYWPECCCGISTCCCFATWMAIGGTLFVTISAAIAMMMCGFCDESDDSTYTGETNAGAESKTEAPATESPKQPEAAEPAEEAKGGCSCLCIVIIAIAAVVVIVGLVYCCSGNNKSEMEEESDEEEQP